RPVIGAYLITCQGRDAMLEKTLASFAESDWGEEPVIIKNQPDETPGWRSTAINSRRAMQTAWDDGVDWMLFVEGDVFVNRNLRHNLLNWKPLRDRAVDFGSLYIPAKILDPWVGVNRAENWRIARQSRKYTGDWTKDHIWGSQAYLLSRRFLWRLLQD